MEFPEDIWNNIKTEWLGLGENWNAGFKEWCQGSPHAIALCSDPMFAEYNSFNDRLCLPQEDGTRRNTTPTFSLWWYKYNDFLPCFRPIRKQFELSRETKMGRLHMVYFYWDLQGKHGPHAKYKADFKYIVDGKKHWDTMFSQPWFEIRLCHLPFVETNHDGPLYSQD